MLFYTPGNNSTKTSFQIELKEDKDIIGQSFLIIENISMNGHSVYDKPEMECTFTRNWKELKDDIKSYIAIPMHNIIFETNIPNLEDSQRVKIDYPFSLKINAQ